MTDSEEDLHSLSGESRPNPDPTRLTISAMRRDISSLRELLEAKLQGHIETADTRIHALDVAIGKADTDRARQLEAQSVLIQTLTAGLETRLGDVKERLTKLESTGLGKESAIEGRQTSSRDNVATIGMVVAALIGVFGVVTALWNRSPTSSGSQPPVTINVPSQVSGL